MMSLGKILSDNGLCALSRNSTEFQKFAMEDGPPIYFGITVRVLEWITLRVT